MKNIQLIWVIGFLIFFIISIRAIGQNNIIIKISKKDDYHKMHSFHYFYLDEVIDGSQNDVITFGNIQYEINYIRIWEGSTSLFGCCEYGDARIGHAIRNRKNEAPYNNNFEYYDSLINNQTHVRDSYQELIDLPFFPFPKKIKGFSIEYCLASISYCKCIPNWDYQFSGKVDSLIMIKEFYFIADPNKSDVHFDKDELKIIVNSDYVRSIVGPFN
jgi:hypothetical protein